MGAGATTVAGVEAINVPGVDAAEPATDPEPVTDPKLGVWAWRRGCGTACGC
jgi:hypothetical protein